jgi:hypothetical protein
MMRGLVSGKAMLKFVGGLALGVAVGLYLGSIPAVTQKLGEIGNILAFSALATLL